MIERFDEKSNLYLVEINDNYFSYEKAVDTLHLYKINKFLSKKELPGLNGNDKQMIRNSGGTVVGLRCGCVWNLGHAKNLETFKGTGNIIWLVNIDHQQNEKMKLYLSNELLENISTIIIKIKRDLKLNTILK
jgi:hypothetical protein